MTSVSPSSRQLSALPSESNSASQVLQQQSPLEQTPPTSQSTKQNGSSTTGSKNAARRSSVSQSRDDGSADDTTATKVNSAGRKVAQRSSYSCSVCRGRKVRCDVVLKGIDHNGQPLSPCGNCEWSGAECVIPANNRRRPRVPRGPVPIPGQKLPPRNIPRVPATNGHAAPPQRPLPHFTDINYNINGRENHRQSSGSVSSAQEFTDAYTEPHEEHFLYRNQNSIQAQREKRASLLGANPHAINDLLNSVSMHGDLAATRTLSYSPPANPEFANRILPAYIKPLPARISSDDIAYLRKKGALTIPEERFRNELLGNYVEFVHPYMPLLELFDFLNLIHYNDASKGQLSLFLFQAVMFAGSAFIDMKYLVEMGFETRKAARRAFFQKARLLYDFDYEVDRVALVQALLLMTYWYETPDDQKDTWHWMGVAISLSHTIGLHRNPETSNMDNRRKMLWKRIWWSCFMRDRLVALGMRRPTRIKDEDYDVPMLSLLDFEGGCLVEGNDIIPKKFTFVRDVGKQKELAHLCVAKAKLCLIISQVLTAQYSVLIKDHGMQTFHGGSSSVMLFPKKRVGQQEEVDACSRELREWVAELDPCCKYMPPNKKDILHGYTTTAVQRSLLHMIYFTTLSALHRPQVLPSPAAGQAQNPLINDNSRKCVSEASQGITRICEDLHMFDLERYLPTTGVTVLLPAIIIHLLDIKSFNGEVREKAREGFCTCMQILERLRDNYAAADYATQFLMAAIRKANIHVATKSDKGGNASHPEEGLQNGIVEAVHDSLDGGAEKLYKTPPADFQTEVDPTNFGGMDATAFDHWKVDSMRNSVEPISVAVTNEPHINGADDTEHPTGIHINSPPASETAKAQPTIEPYSGGLGLGSGLGGIGFGGEDFNLDAFFDFETAMDGESAMYGESGIGMDVDGMSRFMDLGGGF